MDVRHLSDPGPLGDDEAAEGSEIARLSLFPAATVNSSILRKGLRTFTFSRKRAIATESEDTWGPHGLHLLHSPPDPLIDVIFVHGLRGGSVKTWCKSDDMRLFWPQAWLPRDPDLQNFRIHSFGSLLGEMATSPTLRKGKQTPILLIGHSMGGLVMKKAYILAQQDERYHDLAGRIRCMFFLATPHRGADSAKLLNTILRASTVLSPKQYVADINRNAGAISIINDEFRHVAEKVQVWSFYETVKMRVGTSYGLIVEKDSAVIGLKHEIIHPMNADHRSICKFDGPSHPNYTFIRNSLAKAAEDVLGDVFGQRADEIRLRIGILEAYMHIAHNPEDDLDAIESKKTEGSCGWVSNLQSFKDWRDADDEPLVCHWLSGQAGAGKSVLATHVIRHLQAMGVDTCFYFFRYGQKAQQTVSSLLRGLAFQMALIHPSVREALFAMRENGVVFDKDDERAIWRKIFVNGILPISAPTTQYWILDGLDECLDPEKLFPLLQKFESGFCIRILFSSRPLPDLEKTLTRFEHRIYRHHITTDDTRPDIERFAENNADELPVDPEKRPALIEKLVEKSDGTFLWIELAIEGLGGAFGEDEVDGVLEEVPSGMAPLYDRILEAMAKNHQHINLIKAILEWTVCGTRPLSTVELEAALVLSLNRRVGDVGRIINKLCAQLLRIDNGMVQMIHATARDFLLSEDTDSIFSVDKEAANEHMATVCLQYLIDDEMTPPRHAKLVSKRVSRSPFVDYACTSFSDHLVASSSASDDIFMLLDKFFRTTVLAWVEYISKEKQNLYYLSRASKNLRRYLERRKKYVSPLGGQFSNIEKWQMDLLRIVSKFGDNLLRDPSSIHFVVPPLCPSHTGIHQQFGNASNGLRLSGLANTIWDDCICYIDYGQSRAMSLASSDETFAIGMKSGTIKLYQQSTCQEITSFDHGEPVRILKFSNSSRKLVSGGFRQLKMWSIDGELLWSVDRERLRGGHLVAMAFTEGDEGLVTLDQHAILTTLNTEDGKTIWGEGNAEGHKSNPNLSQGSWQIVLSADICPKMELLAIVYRGRPPQIWSIQGDVMIGSCEMARDTPGIPINSVAKVLFNPNPAVEILAVSYQDGELAIFDKWTDGKHEIKSVHSVSLTLASSSDGRTLATGDAIGTIRLWDFDTLTLLYSIKSSEYEVKSLAFSGDGFRLNDIRDTKTKVWEPSVLVRKAISDESSVSESVAMPPPIIGRDREMIDITQIHAPPEAGCIFVGRDDGSVLAYDWVTGAVTTVLYSHRRDVSVTSISWNHSMIATADASHKVEAHALERSTSSDAWLVGDKLFELNLDRIRDLVLHPTDAWLLVFQADSSILVDTITQNEFALSVNSEENYRSWLWLCPPSTPGCLLGARSSEVDIYTTDTVESQQRPDRKWRPLENGAPLAGAIKTISVDKDGKYVAVQLETTPQNPLVSKLLIYKTSHLLGPDREEKNEETGNEPTLSIPNHKIKTFYGFYGDLVVYLDHQLWVRAINVSKVQPSTTFDSLPERYFFIPREFIGSNNGVDGLVTSAGAVVFPKEGELAIVSNAFEWSFSGEPQKIHGISRRRGVGVHTSARGGARQVAS